MSTINKLNLQEFNIFFYKVKLRLLHTQVNLDVSNFLISLIVLFFIKNI